MVDADSEPIESSGNYCPLLEGLSGNFQTVLQSKVWSHLSSQYFSISSNQQENIQYYSISAAAPSKMVLEFFQMDPDSAIFFPLHSLWKQIV
jgi:hypothetical protein